MAPMYYRGAHCAVLCYDVTSRASFASLQSWVEELKRNMPDDILIHLVGTKRDLVEDDPSRRQVPFEDALAYARDHLNLPASTPRSAGVRSATTTRSRSSDRSAASNTPRPRARSGSTPGLFYPRPDAAAASAATSPTSQTLGAAGSHALASSAAIGDDVSDYCHEISSKSEDLQTSGVTVLFDAIARQLVRGAAEHDARERKRRDERGRDKSSGSVHIADRSRAGHRDAHGGRCC